MDICPADPSFSPDGRGAGVSSGGDHRSVARTPLAFQDEGTKDTKAREENKKVAPSCLRVEYGSDLTSRRDLAGQRSYSTPVQHLVLCGGFLTSKCSRLSNHPSYQ
jgi:hypothetical protein